MSLKKNPTSFWPEFKTRLSGSRVKASDAILKELNDKANKNGHAVYAKASKNPLGWSITPKHEQYRNQQVKNDPIQNSLFEQMEAHQNQRKSDSRDTNRARLALGGIILGATGLTAGGSYLAKKIRDKKKEKEQENAYYKTAALKDIATKAGNGLIATGKQISKNFAHAPELEHLYTQMSQGKSIALPLGHRLKDIATFKRVRVANDQIKHIKSNTTIPNTVKNPHLGEINSWIEQKNINDDHVRQFNEWMGSTSKTPSDSMNQSKYLHEQKNQHKILNDEPKYTEKEKTHKAYETNRDKYQKESDFLGSHIGARERKLKNTRNNELAKSIGLYAIPVAATAGGVMLYKRHKKKKKQKEQENKNQVK